MLIHEKFNSFTLYIYVVELREAGGAKEECTNDLRKLEDQLRKKDEECRKQEEELMRSRSNSFIMCIAHVYMYMIHSTICIALNTEIQAVDSKDSI